MSALLRKPGSRFWYLRWYERGKHHEKSLKTANKRVAQYLKAQHNQRLAQRKSHPLDADMTVAQAAERYVEASRAWKSPRTYGIDSQWLDLLCAKIRTVKLLDLSPAQVETTLQTITAERGVSGATRNHYLKTLRAMSRWLVARGYLWEDFTKGITRLKVPIVPRVWLTREQRDQLLEIARQEPVYPMIATALYAGLRWGELATLEWSDVDFDRNLIHVRPKAEWMPKSKRDRLIPLHPTLREILLVRYQRAKHAGMKFPNCFLQPDGLPYRTDNRSEVIQRLLRKVGVKEKRTGWHTLRHTFASLLVQAGESVFKVAAWLGHEDVKTTTIYAHLAPQYDSGIEKL